MFTKKLKDPLVPLRDMILDSSISLADILRRAKVLASQLKNDEFKTWVHNELNGYSETTELPDYRIINIPPLGTFSGPFGSRIDNFMIPTYNLPNGLQQLAKGVPLGNSVRELEEMATKEGLRHTWPTEAVLLMRDKVRMSGGAVLVEVHQPISSTIIQGVLDAIRNRLLDFILELQEAVPEITKENGTYEELPPEKVSQIFNITIHGNHNILASGESITQQATQVIGVGKKDQLKEYLESLGIDKKDIEELLSILEKDKIGEKGKFGTKVSSWIGKMVSKAASGAWNIAIDTAPTLITKGLFKYYGWE